MTTYFDKIEKVNYEGADSTNPFAFKYYDADKVILGKTMADIYVWQYVTGTLSAGLERICSVVHHLIVAGRKTLTR